MNKNDIKQIILEEIEAVLQEMNENMSPEDMAADSRPEEGDEIEGPGWEDMPGAKVHPFVGDQEARIARAMETGDEDELEDLAAGELDRADLDEMARTANVFTLAKEGGIKDVIQFMMRVNNVLKTYKSPGQKRPKKRFTRIEMLDLAKKMTQPGGFTSKDIIDATSYSSPAQANKFLAALEQKGLIKLTSQLKKSMAPERDPDAPETRGRKSKSAEFDAPDDALDMDFGDFEDLDLGDINALEENNNTMTNLEKYIRQQIKEAKNPLAQKMKEIENQGHIAALETKLAAVAEMIEETNGRLSRIDEDNEFADMMDKNAVKEVRKQLKELEKAQAKLQKEYDKAAGGRKKETVVDEDTIDTVVDEVELEEDNFALNESVKRMQKLAGLITESDIKKKLSLNENLDPETTKYLSYRSGGFMMSVYSDLKAGEELKFKFKGAGFDGPDFGKIGNEYITFEENDALKYSVRKLDGDDYEIKVDVKKDLYF